ncbi:MAG: hypothetical protein QM680_07460 [Luteolibacter sp.]
MIALTSADGVVLVMLVVLALSFSIVVTMVWTIRSAGRVRRDREVEQLLAEVAEQVEREERARVQPAPRSSSADEMRPWEKDADWWKN